MKDIIISTESGSDLPQALISRYGFQVIPMHVILNSESHPDGLLPVEKIYEYYETTGKVPTTSAVNTSEYQEFFTRIRQEHPGCVIYHLAYSSTASSTYSNCSHAIRKFEDIYLIDTKSVSGGCTAHLVNTWKLIQQQKDTVSDYGALAAQIQALADRTVCHFIPGTLEYLKAGGRVSNAQYLGATLLNLKPLIEIDPDGRLITTKKYRGSMARVARRFLSDFTEKYNLKRDCLYLMFSKGLDQSILDYMKEFAYASGFESCEYVMTGGVISCHSGRGAIGLAGTLAD
ncbi:MAG: DegV family EDD domain-containing protein [Lachnospiraceae bacterium]|jgi:DegV family protein with EDD domain|nr:DegV family EDD domain-containing protein [Lachnospiraceae bacterium]MCI1657057.1 DegV family EDD domain-containing protein [Lachnospiraceae bacterium]MCI2195518.1 DegV family EDD domain-containing protein [Lachnospiraceae bacterium]HAD18911.1 EDD domain protein [Lachnospiraceae bacterium]